MDPAVAALDIAKAGAILANMIESYLAGGAPPSNPEGADHDDLQDCRSTSVAPSLHLHSSVDDGAGPLQPGEHRAPVQSGEQGTVSRLELGANPDPRPGSRPVRVRERPIARTSRRWSATWPWVKSVRSSPWKPHGWRAPIRTDIVCSSCAPSPAHS